MLVSRRIEADAPTIFAIVADPGRHTEIDGSEMLRGALTDSAVSGVGDVFVLNMFLERLGGDYQMANTVVEYEQDRKIVWEPRRHDVPDSPVGGHLWGYELRPDGEKATVVTEVVIWLEDPVATMRGCAPLSEAPTNVTV